MDLLQVPADRRERYTGRGMHYAIQRKTYRQRYGVDLLLTGERGIHTEVHTERYADKEAYRQRYKSGFTAGPS